jgi:hypothetical protein
MSLTEEAASVPGLNRATVTPPASNPAAPAVPPPSPKEEPIQTNLETIKARREASDKQREENKWLSLLSAGLGIMGGTNKNAFANIGAGGQQGIATFATLEKARREDEAQRRHEDYQQQQLALQNKQIAQQKELTLAQIAKDPDAVRSYAALGGWKAGDPPEKFQSAVLEGFQKSHAAERIKALQDILTASQNPMSGITPEKAKQAQDELLRLGLGPSGGSQFKLLGVKP